MAGTTRSRLGGLRELAGRIADWLGDLLPRPAAKPIPVRVPVRRPARQNR